MFSCTCGRRCLYYCLAGAEAEAEALVGLIRQDYRDVRGLFDRNDWGGRRKKLGHFSPQAIAAKADPLPRGSCGSLRERLLRLRGRIYL